MRLKQIRLAGFKSFVDPTVVKLPSNLVGIVGPNGCGKSNIIDAVRWVMGEASAKQLRGDSMVDVIFNGSTGRKPVSLASVELCFDNTDGRLGGEYANYSEISIKRTVNREAVSHYYLNGARCRRKDILDVFLGTGLGPRSYAIIEQGTISRVVEAKPDELRSYFEEVSGISKYKERRRETENRLKHTEENLARLNDIRDELDKQLKHLNRQAETAEKYKTYRETCRLKTAEWQALQWRAWDTELREIDNSINQEEVNYEATMATLRRVDAELEREREQLSAAHEVVNSVQSEYYRVGAETQRYEQEQQHRLERIRQLESDHAQHVKLLAEVSEQITHDTAVLQEIRENIAILTPKVADSEILFHQAEEQLSTIRESQRSWQEGWDQFLHKHHQAAQEAEVAQTKIQQLEQRILHLQDRKDKLEREQAEISINTLLAEIAHLEDSLESTVEAADSQNELCLDQKQTLLSLREQLDKINRDINEQNTQQQQYLGQQASLQALQQVALGKDNAKRVSWLADLNFDQNPRLAETLIVEPGYEKAVEAILAPELQSICLQDQEELLPLLTTLPPCDMTFVFAQHNDHANPNEHLPLPSLANFVKSPYALSVLEKILVAPDLATAWQVVKQIPVDYSIITRDGIWLSREWIRVMVEHDATDGVLLREKQLLTLAASIENSTTKLQTFNEQVANQKNLITDAEQQLDQIQQQIASILRQKHEISTQLQVKSQRLAENKARAERLNQEHGNVLNEIAALDNDVKTTRHHWQNALELLAQQSGSRENWLAEREKSRHDYEQAQQQQRAYQQQWHDEKLQCQSLQQREQHLLATLERALKQQEYYQEQQIVIQQQCEENNSPLEHLKQQLNEALSKHHLIAEQLADVRERVSGREQAFRSLTEQRQTTEKSLEIARLQLEQIRLQKQTLTVKCSTLLEQIEASGFELQKVLIELSADATVHEWQEEVARIEQRIQRLGAINLAAIEEYQTQSERKTYLDNQYTDLTDAMETLVAAIRKIDQETRERLQQTYDTVNQHFQTLFPKIFGGGSAQIELTGTDLLEAGISIMARPPGKRNSTIHLLSGGEKALTAIALVFSLFQLNPSPFCLLDEVDAPLDDMNVNRYCRLVKEMSEQVQFIVISHNKITMEMAEQLTGVTMHEPGVSRLVAVDIEAAMTLADVG